MGARRGAVARLPDRPGSLNQLKKLGDAIRDSDVEAYRGLHYREVWSWCNDLVAAAVRDIADLDLATILDEPALVSVTGRAKILQTVREKLQRRRSDKLPAIQDLAGVRVEAAMTLTQQDRMAEAIRRHFDQEAEAVHDLRDGSHAGYRGVHVWVRLDEPRGAWFEVQVRTLLQGRWANMYEALADEFGRGIRYGEMPESPAAVRAIEIAHRLSTHHAATVEQFQDFWSAVRRSGKLTDEVRLAGFLERLGHDEGDAKRIARRARDLSDKSIDELIDARVNVLSQALREIESDVRSFSLGKGE